MGGFVFSTNEDFNPNMNENSDTEGSVAPRDQDLEAHYSSKGRAGKKVIVIKGFEGPSEELEELGKELKRKCGVGGSVKNGEIIIQGDVRNKVMQILEEEGYKVKRIGG